LELWRYGIPLEVICSKWRQWICANGERIWIKWFSDISTLGHYVWSVENGQIKARLRMTKEQVMFVHKMQEMHRFLDGERKKEIEQILSRLADAFCQIETF